MDHIIRTFELALEKGLRVKIIYQSDGELTERTVIPKELKEDSAVCYCCLRRGKRIFKYDSILSAQAVFKD